VSDQAQAAMEAWPMKISAVAAYLGGKRTLAPVIVRELGPHSQYFEPFCGSCAVLLAKEPAQKETVNDLHGWLINLVRVVASDRWAPWLYEKLSRTLFCEELLREAQEMLKGAEPDPPRRPGKADAEQAYWYFIACWMGRNGAAGTRRTDYQIAVRWTKGGGSATVRWVNTIDSIPAWHRRLRNVVILRRDAFRMLDRFEDCEQTAIYCDPPYVMDSRSDPGAHWADRQYVHDFSSAAEATGASVVGGLFGGQGEDKKPADKHEQLRDVLAGYERARVVVSYYDCPRVRHLYRPEDGWVIVEHPTVKNFARGNARAVKLPKAPEILILNGPSYAADGGKPC